MRILGERRDSVLGVTCAPDGKHVVSTSFREHVLIWIACHKLEDSPESVAWGSEIVVGAGKRVLAF